VEKGQVLFRVDDRAARAARAEAEAAIREARAAFPKSDEYPGPAPFTATEFADDLARYTVDCDALAQLPNVTLLQLPGTDAARA